MRVIYFYLKLFLKLCKKGKRRCLNENKRARQKKAEIKEEVGKKGGEQKGSQKQEKEGIGQPTIWPKEYKE